MKHTFLLKTLFFLIGLASLPSWAESGRNDYDLDNDGLIEINDLQDLNAIRNNLDGRALYNATKGCPGTGCNGFELTKNLDFDTNANGKLDSADTYWNNSLGWLPIGDAYNSFSAIFDGNGFVIRNLRINSLDEVHPKGLFSTTSEAHILNLGITGPWVSLKTVTNTGILVGRADRTKFSGVFVTGFINSGDVMLGGVAGYAESVDITDSFSSVLMSGKVNGGLLGYAYNSVIRHSYALGNSTSGLIDSSSGDNNNSLDQSYFIGSAAEETLFGTRLTLKQLQCPAAANNQTCVSNLPILQGWEKSIDNNHVEWQFEAGKVPALVIHGKVFRDNDADGYLDSEDKFPSNPEFGQDSDSDGAADRWSLLCDQGCRAAGPNPDQFPKNPAASVDADLDGQPDAWNSTCDAACQSGSGLTLDKSLNDSDNDGINNVQDSDDDNDGKKDIDADSDGLIDITTLKDLNAIRYNLSGTGQQFSQTGTVFKSGCPIVHVEGVIQPACHGYELLNNLDFDTNADGKMNASDAYWNQGEGWRPIGEYNNPFSAVFDGNGFVIRNLFIHSPESNNSLGLFGTVKRATIANLGMTGSLTSVHDGFNGDTGLLAGVAIDSLFAVLFASIPADGQSLFLINTVKDIGMRDTFVTGLSRVFNPFPSEGLIHLVRIWSIGPRSPNKFVGHTTNQHNLDQGFLHNFGTPSEEMSFSLAELQCPKAPTNYDCVPGSILYDQWNTSTTNDQAYWIFEAGKLPGLNVKGKIYRDADGDGVLDAEDVWPNQAAAFQDLDGDGAPEAWLSRCDSVCRAASGLSLDQFPKTSAAILDVDLDGRPDAWRPGCDEACQRASGLTLDVYPGDLDNDGLDDKADLDDNSDGQLDADSDSDGLLDVSNLDQLNAIRFAVTGVGRVLAAGESQDSSGCPGLIVKGRLVRQCQGYELMNDLNFDTNADGKLDAADAYWHEGQGWQSIVGNEIDTETGSAKPFQAIFEGNGFVIRNLFLHQNQEKSAALFGHTQNATIRNVGVIGVEGQPGLTPGVFVGYAKRTLLEGVFATKLIGNQDQVIPLISYGEQSTIRNSFTTLSGHLLGGTTGQYRVENAYAVGSRTYFESDQFGGDFVNTYWANDFKSVPSERWNPSGTGFGVPLKSMRCPSANNDTCVAGLKLYQDWQLAMNDSQPYWQFEADRLPGLVLNGKVYRDSDADGTLDSEDKFPIHFAATLDADGDGMPDRWSVDCDEKCRASSGLVLDQFPNQVAASVDLDLDGRPDSWNPACGEVCRTLSGLTLDAFPLDADNDGLSDLTDTDDNNDGQMDVDTDSDGLIEIKTFAELDAIRYSLKGLGRQLSEKGVLETNGCPSRVFDGLWVKQCRGYELTADLDFDTNADGKLDAADTYWNSGEGWLPIGDDTHPFSTLLEGNGFVIRNLMVNRPEKGASGLFANTRGAVIRRMGITGPLMSIIGFAYAGSFVAEAYDTLLEGVFATGKVEVKYPRFGAGGLIGRIYSGGSIRNAFTSVVLKSIASHLIVGVDGYGNLGPLLVLGKAEGSSGITAYQTNVYWAADLMNQPRSGNGVTLAQLRCPGAANDTQCAPGVTLYKNWDLEKDGEQNYWVFEAGKLPGLVLNGKVYRDETVTAPISSSSSRTSSSSSVQSSSVQSSSSLSSSNSSSSLVSSSSTSRSSSLSSSSINSSKSSSSKSSAASSSGNTQKGGSLGWGFMVVLMLLGCRRRLAIAG